jgi:holliday junction DNA helicase RuvA
MIHQVRGTVLSRQPGGVVVNVGGWGVLVYTSINESFDAGEPVVLNTHLCLKKDGLELYGFSDLKDKAFFAQLMTVPGVGPKTALAILSRAPRESLEQAIATRDLSYLTRVAGLGKKSAEKVLLELSEKVSAPGGSVSTVDADVFDTLVALGYTDR